MPCIPGSVALSGETSHDGREQAGGTDFWLLFGRIQAKLGELILWIIPPGQQGEAGGYTQGSTFSGTANSLHGEGGECQCPDEPSRALPRLVRPWWSCLSWASPSCCR